LQQKRANVFFIVNIAYIKYMKKLKYDACELRLELEKHRILYKDLAAVGSLMIFLQSDKGVFKNANFPQALPFMKKGAIERLLIKLDGKILEIVEDDEDRRLRVIKWTIDWAKFVYEVDA